MKLCAASFLFWCHCLGFHVTSVTFDSSFGPCSSNFGWNCWDYFHSLGVGFCFCGRSNNRSIIAGQCHHWDLIFWMWVPPIPWVGEWKKERRIDWMASFFTGHFEFCLLWLRDIGVLLIRFDKWWIAVVIRSTPVDWPLHCMKTVLADR